MGTAIGSAHAKTRAVGFRPGLALQHETQVTVARRPRLRRHGAILIRHSLLPVDVDFFEMAVGIDGEKFTTHSVRLLRSS
jgi:hypothetical protein